MHAERGNIQMVVANVTALQRHWPVLVKQRADWLALTEVRVRQREIPMMRAQLLNSGYDSEWRKPVESANECGGVSFCFRTPEFAAVVLDEDFPEMRWLGETRRVELFAMPTGTQKITVYVLVVCGLQSQLEVKEKKNEELYNACTRTVLRMGNLPTSMVGDLQRDPSGTSRQLMVAKTPHLLFDVAEHFTQGTPEST